MHDFLFIIEKSTLPVMKVNLNFRDFVSYHAAVKANCKPTYLLENKKTKWNHTNFFTSLCYTLLCLLLFCGEHACSLWKTAHETVAVWEESTAANVTHESVWSWLFLAVGLGLDNQMKTHSVGQLEIDIQEAETEATIHFQRVSSYVKCMTVWVSTKNTESVASMRPKTIKRPRRVADVAILILCFGLHTRSLATKRPVRNYQILTELEKPSHVWQAVYCSRFRQIKRYLDLLCGYKNHRPLNTASTMPGCTKIVSRSWVHSKGPGWNEAKPSKNLNQPVQCQKFEFA